MNTFQFGDPGAGRVLIQPADLRELAGMETEVSLIRELSGADFCLTALEIRDWNRELSPWPAPAVFGREGLGDGAGETLDRILALCRDRSKTYYLGGYSLAGLFSLWAAGQTEVFSGVAAASPSVWLPGFPAYMAQHPTRAGRLYLSLGDREEKVRNPLLASVGDNIRQIHRLLLDQGRDCVLEWNPGNHFRDPERRTAAAFAWLLRSEAAADRKLRNPGGKDENHEA